MTQTHVSRVEVEYSWVWATAYPALFCVSLADFLAEHPKKDWEITIDNGRLGFMMVVAKPKVTLPLVHWLDDRRAG